MKFICCLLASVLFVFPTLAEALSRDDAYALARAGDAAAIEAAFSAHQASFNAGEIGMGSYRAPYEVFNTTEPKVEATLEGWLTTYPVSPQAAAARAIQLFHIAFLVRGGDFVQKTPSAAMERFGNMSNEALDLARRALDAEPRHLAAGHELMTIAVFVGARDARDRGFRVVEELDTPANALLAGLQFNFKRWGGGPEATRRFCEERAPLVADIRVEECLALADYKQRDQYPERVEAAVATLSKGSETHFLEQRIAAMSMGGRPKEAYELARSRGFMTYEFAYALVNALDDWTYVEEFAARRLRDDPLNPVDLAVHATTLRERGEHDAAWAAYEKAVLYGAHQPFVRRSRIQALASNPELGGDFLQEITDALDATDYEVELLGLALHYVMYPAQDITHLEDGSPRPGFKCTRLGILERHQQMCEAGVRHYSCSPGLAEQRDTMIIEGRAKAACGETTERSWRDVVRYLLDLSE